MGSIHGISLMQTSPIRGLPNLLESTNAIDLVAWMDNCWSTPLRSREDDINKLRRVGDRPHLLEVVYWHLSFSI
jgi:hypothetical protein